MPLLEQATSAMANDKFPLFVAEGSSNQKLAKIKHSAYLHHCYKSFSTQMGQNSQCLFIYGHSLADNDQHILKKISKGKVQKIYIALHGDVEEPWNAEIFKSVASIVARRKSKNGELKVAYFDASSAKVWG